jgi:hypothetical protein
MIPLGVKARDVVTGFVGVVVARTVWMAGCVRVTLAPSVDKDGKVQDQVTFDEDTVEVLDPEPTKLPRGAAGNEMVLRTVGGERPGPAPRVDPRRAS